MLLNNPTKGKLDPHWAGPWVVLQCDDPTTVRLKMGTGEQMAHIYHVCLLLEENKDADVSAQWSPPLFSSGNDANDLDSPSASNDSRGLPDPLMLTN